MNKFINEAQKLVKILLFGDEMWWKLVENVCLCIVHCGNIVSAVQKSALGQIK